MIRARFHVNKEDYRPVNWPIKHPYWCTGYGADYAVIVAYADGEAEILRNWPDASHIDSDEADGRSSRTALSSRGSRRARRRGSRAMTDPTTEHATASR